jgi:hypothetical protein
MAMPFAFNLSRFLSPSPWTGLQHSPETLWKQVIRHDKHRMYSHFRPYFSEKAHNFTKRTTTWILFATYSSCPPAYPTPASLPNILIKRKKEFGTDLESGNNLRSCISTWNKMTQRRFSKFEDDSKTWPPILSRNEKTLSRNNSRSQTHAD